MNKQLGFAVAVVVILAVLAFFSGTALAEGEARLAMLDLPQIRVQYKPQKISAYNVSPYGATGVRGDKKVLAAVAGTGYDKKVKMAMTAAVSYSDPVECLVRNGQHADYYTDGGKGNTGAKGLYHNPPAGYAMDWPFAAASAKCWKVETAEASCVIPVIDDCGNVIPECVAKAPTPPPPPPPPKESAENGICGSSNGKTFESAPSENLCADNASVSVTEEDGRYVWLCPGKNGGKDVQCSALLGKPPERLPPMDSSVIKAPRLMYPEYEASLGIFGNKNVHSDDAHYLGTDFHLEARPFTTRVGEEDLWANAGIFLDAGNGMGTDRLYEFFTKTVAGGLSGKLFGDNWDVTENLGLRWLGGNGHTTDWRYKSEQDSRLISSQTRQSFYKRRAEGKLWFPKLDIVETIELQIGADFKSSWDGQSLKGEPYDNSRIGIEATQYVYDFFFGDGDKRSEQVRLSPGFFLGGGHEYGPGLPYLSFGLCLAAGFGDDDVLLVNAGYREQLGGDGDLLTAGIFSFPLKLYQISRKAHISRASQSDEEERLEYLRGGGE